MWEENETKSDIISLGVGGAQISAAPPTLGWLQLHSMYMLPSNWLSTCIVSINYHHIFYFSPHTIKIFKKTSLTLKSFFRSTLSIFALFFLVFVSIFTRSKQMQKIMYSLYPHNILALKRLHHTFSQRHPAIFTLVADEFEFSFGLMKLRRL